MRDTRTSVHALSRSLVRLVHEAAGKERPSFADLVRAAGLDPATDFIGATLRDLDFRDDDLRGFKFSGADLTGAVCRRAILGGVRFERAILVGAIGLSPSAPEKTTSSLDIFPVK